MNDEGKTLEPAELAVSRATDPAILAYAQDIIDAPDEWTPHYTRSELLPMARAYVVLHTPSGCPIYGQARSTSECEVCHGDIVNCPVYGDGERARQALDFDTASLTPPRSKP